METGGMEIEYRYPFSIPRLGIFPDVATSDDMSPQQQVQTGLTRKSASRKIAFDGTDERTTDKGYRSLSEKTKRDNCCFPITLGSTVPQKPPKKINRQLVDEDEDLPAPPKPATMTGRRATVIATSPSKVDMSPSTSKRGRNNVAKHGPYPPTRPWPSSSPNPITPSMSGLSRTRRGLRSPSILSGGCKNIVEAIADNSDSNFVINFLIERVNVLESEMQEIKSAPTCPCISCDCCNTSSVVAKRKLKKPSSVCSKVPSLRTKSKLMNRNSGQQLAPTVDVDADAFCRWYLADDQTEMPRIPIPTKEVVGVPREWFAALINPCQWLDDEHMNALLNAVVRDLQPEGQWLKAWTILETHCWGALTQPIGPNVVENLALVMPYVNGTAPSVGNLKWQLASTIYGVGNIMENHWVLYEISLVHRRIHVYDSMSNGLGWENLAPKFEVLARNLPVVCSAFREESHRSWDVLRYTDPPQQENNFDCGIMVLDYFRNLVTGQSVDDVDPAMSGPRRVYYCGLLYKRGMAKFSEMARR